MTRLPDWETRLAAYLDANAARPFEYGQHDCALFVAGAVDAMTGNDFGAAFRGRYRSAAGSIRALKLYGTGDLPGTLTAALGDPVPLALAHRGDVCGFEGAVGILMPDHGIFVGEADLRPELFGLGLVKVPRAQLSPMCWAVSF